MPVVLAYDVEDSAEQPVCIVFPRRTRGDGAGGWTWDEVAVAPSKIHGYGLQTRRAPQLDWSRLAHPVFMPFLGRETEFSSAFEAEVFCRVLQGIHSES